MKTLCFLLLSMCLPSAYLYAQTENNLYIGLNTGAGPSIQWTTVKDVFLTDDQGNLTVKGDFKFRMLGYHVPVTVPIQFGRGKWRAGIDLGYEYVHFVRVNPPMITASSAPYETPQINVSYHLFKAGANFEYDLWSKKGNTIGIAVKAGYYSIVKYSYSTMLFHPPFIYGSVGLQGTRELPHGFLFTYGVNFGVQGYRYYYPYGNVGKGSSVLFQPELVVGFKKRISLSKKAKK